MRQIPLSSALFAALVFACTGKTVPEIAPPDTSETEPSNGAPAATVSQGESDGGTAGPSPSSAPPKGVCETTRTYFESCGQADELMCGATFDAWCALSDKMNSEALRRAEAACLTSQNCDGAARRACEYAHYSEEEKLTASQRALVSAYCRSCEPDHVDDCSRRSTTFNKKRGIEAVPDIFIAAWEFADPVVDVIKTACTGEGLGHSGPDSSSCAEAFAKCAGDVYLDRLPECPK